MLSRSEQQWYHPITTRYKSHLLQTIVNCLHLDWLQTDNQTVFDGIVRVMERDCYSWTRDIPDTAKFSWLTSVSNGVPCRLAWPNIMQANIAFYSDDRSEFPQGIFQVPSYCPHQVTDPNCDVMHF